MGELKVYHYPQCGTCRDALKWLDRHGVAAERIHIVENPPSAEELREYIRRSGQEIKKFFNVSGQVYKQMNLKDKLADLSDDEKINLLAANGKLIKRPLVTDGSKVTVGFKESEFEQCWK